VRAPLRWLGGGGGQEEAEKTHGKGHQSAAERVGENAGGGRCIVWGLGEVPLSEHGIGCVVGREVGQTPGWQRRLKTSQKGSNHA